MIPTEKIQWFWEQCGFWRCGGNWMRPNDIIYGTGLPPIDLNSLFKYAVPKVVDIIAKQLRLQWWHAYQVLFERWHWNIINQATDPTLALFWTLYSIKEARNERAE